MNRKMTRREEYLKLIYILSKKGDVRGADLADELEIKRPTVCVYLKRLMEIGDIVMDEHRRIHLTAQGQSIAESALDKHDMLAALLQDLGVPDEIAAKDAHVLGRNLSPETCTAFRQLLLERQEQ